MGKSLFLTGGSRGIGAAIVKEACRSGWDVAFTYVAHRDDAQAVIDSCREIDPSRTVRYWKLEVRDASRVDEVVDEVVEAFGGIEAVVANAGVSLNGLAYTTGDDEWRTVIDTNLTGTFHVCRAFLPELVARRSGRIVILSSVTAGGASGQAAYAASKAGLEGLAATLAKEYGPKGITTNVVVPGYFDTDMTREGMSEDLSRFAVSYCPLRRLGTLDEIARTVLFLVGEGAGFINGAALRVTGGLDWAP
jgi:NAD(P)-dependent dehydrogenase (short-subunit alcohol dehydrogenase family)